MEKIEQNASESMGWRFKLIKLLQIDVEQYMLPFFHIELILDVIFYTQMLKYSVDYYPAYWFGNNQPVFLYLDLSYYFNYVSANAYFGSLVAIIAIINLYWIAPLFLHLNQIERTNPVNNLLKMVFHLFKSVLVLPLINSLLNLFNCYGNSVTPFRKCFESYSYLLIVMALLSFVVFMAFLVGQIYLDFEFIRREKQETRIKRTGITNSILVLYAVVNELNNYFFSNATQLAILNLTTLALLVVVVLIKDEVSESIKVMQYAFISVQLLATLFVDIASILNPPLPTFLFPLLAPLLFLAVMQLKTTSLRFELDNINKWPTPEIMISYARKLRDYIALRDDYAYIVYIHGYMEIHRQKCDNPMCPSRCALSESERKLFESGDWRKNHEQILRCENIIKKIYSDGYKLTPISPELQLENALFLYERKDKELSLRNLLAIKLDRLSLDKIYRYQFMKDKIHKELNMRSNKFLDLVSEMLAKKEEEEIFQRFEKAALINLEFWSLLNDDHPDFQKLNQVALARIRIRDEIRSNYSQICSIAHSERVTAFYANYLESIENDEHMFNEIYGDIKKKFHLDEKITLQDWANSSSNIMLVSIEEASFGKIVDINTSCATALGYQKFELANQFLKNLFLDELKNEIKDFLGERTNGLEFYMTHKSGYLMRIVKYAQNYNSMETGMTAILNIELALTPGSCSLVLDKAGKIMGVTPTIIPLLGLDLRTFEVEINALAFFAPSLKALAQMSRDNETTFPLREILKPEFLEGEQKSGSQFRIRHGEHLKHITIELQEINRKRSNMHRAKASQIQDFEFQVDASIGSFKFVGTTNQHSSNLSHFSKHNYSELEVENQNINSLSAGIATLRLRNNVIQIIESEEELDVDQQNGLNGEISSQRMMLPRKDEEEIFESKDSFEKFILDYRIAASALIIMGVGVAGIIGLLCGYYAVYASHNSNITPLSLELAYQHLINGAIAKEQCLIQGLQLAASNLSAETGQLFLSLYQDNMNYLEDIQLLGSQPFPLQLDIDQSTTTLLSRSFILTMVNYVNQYISSFPGTATAKQMWSSFSSLDQYIQSFLSLGAGQAKEQMYSYIIGRESDMLAVLGSYIEVETVMISMAMLYLAIFTVLISVVVNRINSERISIFEIFLEISDSKIQQFSNRTEKLLVSLHVEDTNEDMDEDPEKKINSNTFSKKKSFKQISFGKSIYLKIIIIPLFFVGYFIHSYTVSVININFQTVALPYFRLSPFADFQLYSNFTQIEEAILNPNSSVNGFAIGTQFREHFRSYMEVHYNSFGYVPAFHEAWNDLYFLDICPGQLSPMGNTTIQEGCSISNLTDNGTFLVINDIITKIEAQNYSLPLHLSYIYKFETISKVHRLLTTFLIQAQQTLSSNFQSSLLQVLVIWLLCGIALVLFWAVPVTRNFVMEINQIKNIISVLPISLAKDLPNARKYFYKILNQEKC